MFENSRQQDNRITTYLLIYALSSFVFFFFNQVPWCQKHLLIVAVASYFTSSLSYVIIVLCKLGGTYVGYAHSIYRDTRKPPLDALDGDGISNRRVTGKRSGFSCCGRPRIVLSLYILPMVIKVTVVNFVWAKRTCHTRDQPRVTTILSRYPLLDSRGVQICPYPRRES